VAAALFFLELFPMRILAYLDPGTGSFFMQMAVGGFLGGLLMIKQFWRRIRQALTRRFHEAG
jgi:membrane associated rhomboid family serine protease